MKIEPIQIEINIPVLNELKDTIKLVEDLQKSNPNQTFEVVIKVAP